MGLIPGGAYRNRNHVAQLLEAGNTDEMYVDLLSDPQTSGGLLAAVPEEEKDAILEEFDKAQMETKVSAVSYTHLDVYKRQTLRFLSPSRPCLLRRPHG